MARKTLTYTVTAEGRDQGKTFLLREMPASQGEKWAAKAFLAMARSGVEVPENLQDMGLAGIAAVGLKALSGVKFEDAEPLLDEMFQCIVILPDPNKPNVTRKLVEDDIEEIFTRLQLRKEIFNLHVGFFTSAAQSKST